MPPSGTLFALSVLLVLASCSDHPKPRAEKTLRAVGAPALRQEAAALYKELFVTSQGKYFVPKPDQWPATFQRFEPLNVRAYMDGFSLCLLDARGVEEGIYVVPIGMDRVPSESRNVHFKKIEEGIYWYHFSE